jgi:tetratricopeptide (TPR) repeat protein
MVTPSVMRARRQLRRATRYAAADRQADAVPLARRACTVLGRVSQRNRLKRDEYAGGLTALADLHLALVDLAAALETLDVLVALLDQVGTGSADQAARDQLADALTRRGNTLRLLALHEQAHADLERAQELAHNPLVRAGAHNAAGILAKDTGQHDTAARHYQQALDLAVHVHGRHDPRLASLLHNLAGLKHAQGKYAEGEPYARLAVDLREQQTGPDSVELAGDLAVLGALLAGRDRLEEAERISTRTLDIWTRRRGPTHYEVAVALHNLAALDATRGRLEQARRRYQHALQIKRRVLREDHPEVRALATTLDRLDNALRPPARTVAEQPSLHDPPTRADDRADVQPPGRAR